MNKIYKVIWSKVKSCYVVVSEIAGSNGKSRRGRASKSALVAVLAVMLGFGGIVGSEAATVNDGDTLNGSTHITVTKDEGTNTITISTTGLATTDEVTALNTKVDANTGKINTNTTKIGENKTKIDANTGKIDTNTTKIGENKTKIDANTGKINANTTKIGENKTKIDANTGKINTNITNINANTAQINALKTLTAKVGLDANRPGVKYFRANSTGEDASATGADAVAVGTKAKAAGKNTVVMGVEAEAAGTAEGAVAVGVKATANAHDSVSVGNNARNAGSAENGVAIGTNAVSGSFSGMTADGDGGVVVIGGGKNSVSVGNNANARGIASIALGDGAVVKNDGANTALNYNSMAIGTKAGTVASNNAMAIGNRASVSQNSHSAIAVGDGAQAGKEAATAIGKEAAANGKNSLAAGTSAVAEGENAVSIGQGTEAKGGNAVAIGNASKTAGANSVAVGNEASAKAVKSVSIGIGAGKNMVGDVLGTKGSHVSIGDEAGQNVDGQHDIAIGTKAGGNVASNYNIAIGTEAGTNMGTAGNPSTGKNVSIGYNANKNDNLVARIQSTAVGSHTQAADDALALGYNAKAAGNGSVAAGFNAKAEDAASMALGQGASASGGNIAIGNGSQASMAMLSGTGYLTGTAAPSTGVSVGTAAALRRITNVADGAQDQDAVTVAQLKKSIDETVRQINANITPGTGSTGVFYDTVTGGRESITLKNTDQKGTLIHNVAAGENDTDAVNVKQMKETMDQAKTHYYSVKSTSANNYNNDMAAGEDSMAAGVSAKALEKRSVAIGNNVQAQGEGSIALGTGYEETNGGTSSLTQTLAVTGYKYNMAIGAGAESYGNHSIAMGTRAVTSIKNGGSSVDKAVAIGYTAGASDDKAIAIGSEAKSNSKSATAVGDQSQALANNALAIGTTARATKESSGAIGTANTVSGVGTYVIGAQNSAPAAGVISNGSDIKAANSGVFGNENTLDGENNRVVGNSNIVKKETAKGLSDIMLTGNNNTVSGDPDTSTQDDAGKVSGITITGSKNTVKAVNNTKPLTDVQIVGNNNTIDTSNKTLDLSNTQVLGSNVTATMGNSVYLGSGSAYVAAGASTKGMAAYSGDGTYAYAGGTPAGVVTVGAKGKERRIQNVAAGFVGSQSTDAVNGSQLYTMTLPLRFGGDNSTIGATSAADVNVVKRGSDQAMSILGGADGSKLSDSNIGVVADAVNNRFNIKLAKELKGLTSVTTGDTVMNSNGVTITGGPKIVKTGIDAGNKQITNVTSGGTTDSNAANIGDVKTAVNNAVTNVTNALTVKGLDFEGNDGAANKVHRDLGTKLTIKGGLSDVTTGVSGKNLGVKKNAAGDGLDLVMSEKPEFTEVTAGTGTNKVVINDNGVHVGGKTYINNNGLNANNQKITNVAAGTDNSDAVNFGQLKNFVASEKTILKDGKNTTVEGDGTANNPYKVNVNDDLVLGKAGADGKDGSIGVNGKDGSAVVINGKDGSIGLNGTNGANGLTIKGANGANGVDGTDGNNGTNGMTRIVYEDKNGVTHEVATMGDGLKFAGNTGTVAKKLNETMTIKGTGTKADAEYDSSNIKTMVNGNGEMIVGLDKNLKADSLAINGKDGKDGATIKGGDGKPGVDGTNITRLVIEEKDGTQHDIATLDDGMKYGGDTGNVIKKKLNEQVNVVGGITDESKLTTEDNLGVVSDGSNNLKVKMAKELKGLTSVTTKDAAGNTTVTNGAGTTMTDGAGNKTEVTAGGITITPKTPGAGKTNVSLTADGLDNGGNKITNVAAGTDDTDAVNVSQLKNQSSELIKKGFGIQAEDGQKVHKDLGSDVEVVGDGKNITTKVEDGKVKVALKDDINVNSVTAKDAAGNTTVTNGAGTTMTDSAGNKTEVTAGGIAINKHDNLNPDGTVKDPQKTVSLTADGLNNGGNQIHNVAEGTAGTDAVNVDQLKKAVASATTKVEDGKNTTVTSETNPDGSKTYHVNLNDNINLGEKGENGKDGSIGVNGKDGSAVVINGKDGSIGLNGTNGANGLTIKGANGANGVDGTDGNNGTNGMTRIVYEDKNGVTHEVATMGDGLKFAGNTGTVAKKLNETMTIKGTGTKADAEYDSSNIKTMVNGNGEMIVGLDKNLKADSLAINGKDGKDGATIKGGDGKPGVDGTNITRLVIEEKDGTQHDIATLDDGMKYGGDTGNVIKKKLNEQVNVVGGITDESKLTTEDNLGVVSDGSNNLKVRMAKDLKGLESVTTKTITAETGNITTLNSDTVNAKTVNATTVKTGDTTINDNGLTINNGPSITKSGVDAGDKKITNVAPGDISPTSKDAVNGSQLFQTTQSISKLGDRVNKVGAGAAALAALHPLDFDPDDKWDVAAGYGHYRNANAGAVGVFYRPNEDTMFSVGGSFGGGENMVNAGVSVKLGQGNHVSTSKVAMAKEIVDLRDENKDLKKRLDTMEQKMNSILGILDMDKKKDFPDVPENHWAYDYVATLAGNGIIEGYPDGMFSGERSMTRYEFAAMFYRALKNGAPVDDNMDRAMNEFEPELRQIRLDRIRVDRISGKDNDRNKVERVRVNSEDDAANNDYRDVYGSHISPEA